MSKFHCLHQLVVVVLMCDVPCTLYERPSCDEAYSVTLSHTHARFECVLIDGCHLSRQNDTRTACLCGRGCEPLGALIIVSLPGWTGAATDSSPEVRVVRMKEISSVS
jgi:hypothetical protein